MRTTLIFLFFAFACTAFSQNTVVIGRVTDAQGEGISGALVKPDSGQAAITDLQGGYELKLWPGKYIVTISSLGYKPASFPLTVGDSTPVLMKVIRLEEEVTEIGTVVVTAGKFEQKIEEVTISMEVIKPRLVESKNTMNMEHLVDQVPGVSMMDGQINIRCGSGFSYGAGSRVLLLVDDLPMLSADAGDVKWNFIAIENIEQIEVIKGASSALFGSSALNGVVNVRTAYPRDEPQTTINISSGMYGKPGRKDLAWWDKRNPVFTNASLLHSRKIGNLDLVVGGNVFSDEGYRFLEKEQRYRFNYNLRYRSRKIEGLSFGVNGNYMKVEGGLFILWHNADSAYYPQGLTIQNYSNSRVTIDPFVTYFDGKGNRHSLRTRYYQTRNTNDTQQESTADLYYGEYQYQKRFEKELTLTSGLAFTYSEVSSDSLYGDHFSSNLGIFVQADKKWKKFTFSFGGRAEYFKVDTAETRFNIPLGKDTLQSPLYPVFRTGVNYQLLKYTFLRASFGQGYRFPAIAEKYIKTKVSGLTILPNPSVQPETGWSTELGLKQAVKIKEWKGYIDVSAFWMEYRNMIEFNFDYYFPEWLTNPTFVDYLVYFGAKSINLGRTRITGAELTVAGSGKIGPVEMNILAGYTYTKPINLNRDSAYVETGTDDSTGILKYRYRHNTKFDVEFGYKKVSLGFSLRYNSFMENIDKRFVETLMYDQNTYPLYILPGLKDYRREHNKGDLVMDGRMAVQVSKEARLSLICNNLLNAEYSSRPGDVQPPRNFSLQVLVKF
ncbi:MAG: TonB-dependent receptor [Bacteroidota bacterium]